MHKRKNPIGLPSAVFSAIALFMLVFTHSGIAAEITANFSAGIGVSDNIGRADTNEVNETFEVFGVEFELAEATSRIDAEIHSNFDYINYKDDTFDEEVAGGLDAFVDVTLVPERLNWVVEEDFGQELVDPLAPLTPNNREDVNYFSTGPDIFIPLGSRNHLGVNLRFTNVAYETRPFDNNRASATVTLRRAIRENTTVSVNGVGVRTEFDDETASPDFDRYEGFLRYEVISARNTIGIDVGYTEVEINGETNDGVLFRADWLRAVSPFSSFVFGAGVRYSDQGDIFSISQTTARSLADTGDSGALGVPFLNNFANARYTMNRDRTDASLEFSWNQEDYKDGSNLDRDILRFEANLSRDLSRTFFTVLGFRFDSRNYKYLLRDDDDWRAQATLGYRFGEAFSVSLSYQYAQRRTDAVGSDFDESRGFLRFSYVPVWGR